MKFTKIAGVGLLAGLFSLPASALSITDNGTTTDVGNPDTVLGSTGDITEGGTQCTQFNGGSPEAEECWAESVTGDDYTFDNSKTEPVDYFVTNEDSNTIAFALNYGGGVYIIKNSTFRVLMENVASMDWGVLDFDDLSLAERDNLNLCLTGTDCEFQVSHITEFDGSTNVPEPGTLGLLGLGLLSLGVARRRARKS